MITFEQEKLMKEMEKKLKLCKFIAKPSTWFVEGTECNFDCLCIYPNHLKYKVGDISGLFSGITNETFRGFSGTLPREDEETCQLDEFFIYDESDNEISNLTLLEFINAH